jgi:hypothetical protein
MCACDAPKGRTRAKIERDVTGSQQRRGAAPIGVRKGEGGTFALSRCSRGHGTPSNSGGQSISTSRALRRKAMYSRPKSRSAIKAL